MSLGAAGNGKTKGKTNRVTVPLASGGNPGTGCPEPIRAATVRERPPDSRPAKTSFRGVTPQKTSECPLAYPYGHRAARLVRLAGIATPAIPAVTEAPQVKVLTKRVRVSNNVMVRLLLGQM